MSSYLKASQDGPNGSGKTCTTAQLAVGIALEYGDGRPVHVFDSSDRWPAWKYHIFDVEKVPLVITYSRSVAALQDSVKKAADENCSVYVGDDLTVPWKEGLAAFSFPNGMLPFDRREQLMREWNVFVEPFQIAPFDAIACGRLGYHWENVEGEDGSMQLMQGDSKFNAGGGENFGYECILELEMRRRKRRLLGLIRGKTTMEYVCDVIKDANGIINGGQFTFQDFEKGRYLKGDYKKVLDPFRPHIEFRRQLELSIRSTAKTDKLIVSGKTAYAKNQSERTSLLEELDSNLDFCFGSKQSTQGKMFRNLTLEELNGFLSWSRMEEETVTPDIERNVFVVRAMRKRIQDGEIPQTPEQLKVLIGLAVEDVYHKGRGKTLIEVLGEQSIAQAKTKKANGRDTAA